jgi:hypothetical protein
MRANRNWPTRYGPWPVVQDPPDIAKWRQAASTRVEAGSDPASIATAVRDAIVSDRFWILTHPEFTDVVLDKYRGAMEGRNPRLLADG